MLGRSLIVSACLVLGALFLTRASATEAVPIRESLATFPTDVGAWQGRRLDDFAPEIMKVLGVDDYLNRVYLSSTRPPVSLYIGYYESQRQGDTIHSPMNCLPGAGWEPVETGRMTITVPVGSAPRGSPSAMQSIEVNRYLIGRGLDKQLVLYWYQSHGRVIASEYWGKIYLVTDAIRMNRSDAALVRVISPIARVGELQERSAEDSAVEFVRALFPLLERYLPS